MICDVYDKYQYDIKSGIIKVYNLRFKKLVYYKVVSIKL